MEEIKIDKGYSVNSLESDIFKKILREKFFACIQDFNIDIRYLVKSYKEDLNYLAKFNYFLNVIKQTEHINIFESLLFIEEQENLPVKKLIAFLNSDNMFQIKKEMSEKYNLKNKLDTSATLLDTLFI